MRIAEDKLVLGSMSAKVFVELLRKCSLEEDQVLSIAREYLAQEQQYGRDLERQKRQHNCTRDYVFGHSDLLMELRVYPTQFSGISRSTTSRDGPYAGAEEPGELPEGPRPESGSSDP